MDAKVLWCDVSEPLARTKICPALGIRESMPPGIIDCSPEWGAYVVLMFHDEVCIRVGNGEEERHPAGTLVVWEPGKPEYYGNPHRPWSHSWFHITPNSARSLLSRYPLPVQTPVPSPAVEEADHYLALVYEEIVHHVTPNEDIIENLLHCLIMELSRSLHSDMSPRIPEVFVGLQREIHSEYNRPWTIQLLAEKACMSPPNLYRLFRRYFGVSPMEYVHQIRMRHALRLLQSPQLSIGEIGQRVGYKDIYHFSRTFKRRYGRSPSEFR
jgi:AraC-like DNA-binding protein